MVSLMPLEVTAEEKPSVSELLDKYAESQTKKVIRIIELKYDVETMFLTERQKKFHTR